MKFSRFIAVSLAVVLLVSMIPFTAMAADVPERLKGADRYLTAAAISQEGWDQADTVVLARGDNYADALAGVPLAFKLDAPILLTTPEALHDAALAEINRLGVTDVIILGGTGAVSQDVEDQLTSLGLEVERISGSSRQGTAAAIASRLAPNGVDTAVIALGSNFPDALAAASYAAAAGYPVLLTESSSLPQETADALRGLQVQNTIVVGGSGVIQSGVLSELPQPTRVNGANRFATSVALAEHFQVQADHYYVATGWNFADAIAGSVLAAKEGTGLLLVDETLPESVADFIVANNVKAVTALGGTGSVSDSVMEEINALLAKTSAYTLTVTGPDSVAVNEPTEFTVNLKGDGTGVADLFGTLEYTVSGNGVLEYKDGENWIQLPLSGHFGPAEGFAITPDWDQTTQLRFTPAGHGTFTATVALKADGGEVTSTSFTFETAVDVVPEDFAVARNEAMNYYGYSVGFRLVEGLTPADVEAIEVSLFMGDKLLATNTAKDTLFGLADLKHTSPFNAYNDFENYIEEYWNLGEWQGDALDVPDQAVISVTLADGRVIIVRNTNLTGDPETILPKVWNQEQKKSYATIQAAINAATAGETIFLAPGTHTGNLSITKSINIVGADQDEIFIDASGYDAYGIYVQADDVSFSNFTFLAPAQETNHTYGFKVENSNNLNISNVTVKDSYHTAVDLNNVTGASVDNVTVEGTVRGAGIALTNCTDVTVTNTALSDNAWGDIAVYETGADIVIGEGNSYEIIYTEGSEFTLDLTDSGVQYVLTSTAAPEFVWYFADLDAAKAVAETSATTVLGTVDGSQYYVYTGMSIQAAVDAAQENAAIVVEGQFEEDIVIETPGLTLYTGEWGAEVEGTVQVNASDVTIGGFTFLSLEPGAILQITGAGANATVVGNFFVSDTTAMGIVLDTGTPTGVTIEGNLFRFLHSGVYIHRAENVDIVDNGFSDIAEGAVSIETWARDIEIDNNVVFFATTLVRLWEQYYSEELNFDDEVIIGEGNELWYVDYVVHTGNLR